jgi:hypothetical protein
MDFGFVRFLLKLERNVMTILERVQQLIVFLTQKEAGYLAQIADLRAQLEVALGNDAADAAAIEAARPVVTGLGRRLPMPRSFATLKGNEAYRVEISGNAPDTIQIQYVPEPQK